MPGQSRRPASYKRSKNFDKRSNHPQKILHRSQDRGKAVDHGHDVLIRFHVHVQVVHVVGGRMALTFSTVTLTFNYDRDLDFDVWPWPSISWPWLLSIIWALISANSAHLDFDLELWPWTLQAAWSTWGLFQCVWTFGGIQSRPGGGCGHDGNIGPTVLVGVSKVIVGLVIGIAIPDWFSQSWDSGLRWGFYSPGNVGIPPGLLDFAENMGRTAICGHYNCYL